MDYIEAIKTAAFIFPFVALLFTIPFILNQYHKYGSINKLRSVIIYSFILYMITIYFLVILPLPSKEYVDALDSPKYNLIPFSFITDFIKESPFVITDPKTYLEAFLHPSFYTVFFNVIMFVPFGMYLRYYFKCSLKETLILSFLLSLFFELTQASGLYGIYSRPYRLFDVNDLMINTLGGIIGYYIVGLFKNMLPSRNKIDEDSLIEGTKVSGLRRITLFISDLIMYVFITSFLSLLIKSTYLKYVIFIIYYVIIPYLFDGVTIMGKFLNVKLWFENKRIFMIILRVIFLFFYYFIFPFLALYVLSLIKNYIGFTLIVFLVMGILIALFYFLNIIIILKDKVIYYDKIFKVKYVSLIRYERQK